MSEYSNKEKHTVSIKLDEIPDNVEPIVKLTPQPLHMVLSPVMMPSTISLIHCPYKSPLTVIAHAVSVSAARSRKTVYLETQNQFDSTIIHANCSKNDDPEAILSAVMKRKVDKLPLLDHVTETIPLLDDVKLVVLDGLNILLSNSGNPGSQQRQRDLFHALEVLRRMVNRGGMHLMITDHSTISVKGKVLQPVGGNVLYHGVDSIIRVDKLGINQHAKILVERTPVFPVPSSAVMRISHNDIRKIK